MDKHTILNLIDDLTAEHLADFIMQGIVSLEELRETESLDNSKRVAILNLLKASEDLKRKKQADLEKADDEAWDKVKFGNEFILIEWISNNPENRNINKAKERVLYLQEEREKIRKQKQDILDKIKRNPNSYSPNEIKDFLKNSTLIEQDLLDCNIPQTAIDNLGKIQAPNLQLGETPSAIPNGYTEVYFWGGTGSGKTCALGAILQMAEQNGYLNIATGPGYNYAYQLKNIFTDDGSANDFLPAPSPVETTQYLPFTLKYPDERNSRSVSLIELSGEIFKCFFHKNGNQGFPTRSHENTFNSLNVFLKSNNRKIHFFFIDYDRENRPDKNGLKQSDYLAAASTYFKNNQVFGNTTDAIYVVLTKSDLLLDENGNFVPVSKRVEYAKQYLNDNNYRAFINTLKDTCKKYSINGGKLTVEPFTLGKVYFKEICDFDGSAASNIVEILMERIPGTRKSILGEFLNK